jgi:hypothetical protein
VTVLFRPDHERPWAYEQKVRIDVPNQATERVLSLAGRCIARQLFVAAPGRAADAGRPQLREAREDPWLVPGPAAGAGGEAASWGERGPDRPRILLTFPRGDAGATRAITVGCAALADGAAFKGGPGAFEVDLEPGNRYFAVAGAAKGTVAPGAAASVVFTFAPPEVAETYGLDVGQWARSEARITLTGGFAHPHADLGPVRVLLEGYVLI